MRSSFVCLSLLAFCAPDGGARAQTVEDFYRGKTISLVVGSSPGGGYDTMARAVSRHFGQHVPGKPQVVVRNMPGAGSIAATAFIAKLAPRDGLTIGEVQNNAPFEPLVGTKEADYDPARIAWLGAPSVEVGLLIAWGQSKFKTLDDARRMEMTIGSSGANGTPSFFARLLASVFDLKLKIIPGYPGQNEAWVAMERGELDGYGLTFWSSLAAGKPDWVRDKKVNILLQFGPEREAALADVPYGPDLVTRAEDKAFFEAGYASLKAGRPFLAPPDIPADRLAALRAAMRATFADPEFLAEVARLQMPVDKPSTGEDLQALIERIYRLPPGVIERLRKTAQSY